MNRKCDHGLICILLMTIKLTSIYNISSSYFNFLTGLFSFWCSYKSSSYILDKNSFPQTGLHRSPEHQRLLPRLFITLLKKDAKYVFLKTSLIYVTEIEKFSWCQLEVSSILTTTVHGAVGERQSSISTSTKPMTKKNDLPTEYIQWWCGILL